MFSRRLPASLVPNALARRRAAVPPLYDLTVSNPTRAGISYPPGLLDPLAHPRGLSYDPDPAGLPAAREAVAAEYARAGRRADPASILLTASTSEAYSLLFKLLCDPGDAVLVPWPSYPLFEHLAALEGVRAVGYPLERDHGWQPALPPGAPPGVRAVVAVHPNNPTGSYLDAASRGRVVGWCAERGLALIVDEVFLDYPLDARARPESFAGTEGTLTFTLGGLSKYAGLPQLKLAWTLVSGPDDARAAALEALAFVADNYLPVGTPVAAALGEILAASPAVRTAILERCRSNLGTLQRALTPVPGVTLDKPQGGWSAVVRYPAVVADEQFALQLLEEERVAVQPGWFYDLPGDGWIVLSLLPAPDAFAEGTARLARRLASLEPSPGTR